MESLVGYTTFHFPLSTDHTRRIWIGGFEYELSVKERLHSDAGEKRGLHAFMTLFADSRITGMKVTWYVGLVDKAGQVNPRHARTSLYTKVIAEQDKRHGGFLCDVDELMREAGEFRIGLFIESMALPAYSTSCLLSLGLAHRSSTGELAAAMVNERARQEAQLSMLQDRLQQCEQERAAAIAVSTRVKKMAEEAEEAALLVQKRLEAELALAKQTHATWMAQMTAAGARLELWKRLAASSSPRDGVGGDAGEEVENVVSDTGTGTRSLFCDADAGADDVVIVEAMGDIKSSKKRRVEVASQQAAAMERLWNKASARAALSRRNPAELTQCLVELEAECALIREALVAEGLCVVCMTAKRDVVFQPCKHMIACKSCASKVVKCCLCKAHVKSRLEVYV